MKANEASLLLDPLYTLDLQGKCVSRVPRVWSSVVPLTRRRFRPMIWLYRLQQRLSMTRREALAVVTLAGLFLLGLGVRHFQKQQVPPLQVDSLVARPAADSVTSSASEEASSIPTPSAQNPINVNSASETVLERLPGVGPVLADRIDRYRSNRREFQQVDELQRVNGIGPKTLETLRPLVRVSPPPDSTSSPPPDSTR